MDYEVTMYDGARSQQLQKLDVIQNSATRVIIGAFHMSPIYSLHVESYILHSLWWKYLALKHFIKK